MGTYQTELFEWGSSDKGRKKKGYIYRESATNEISFVDSGRRIDVLDWQHEQALRDALELACAKWGGAKINGTKEYVARCVDIAARYDIKISNPELQERIKERKEALAREKQVNESKDDAKRGERMNKIEEGLAAYDKAVKPTDTV